MDTKRAPVAFDTAYPGSMVERRDGDYVRRDDTPSLAAAMLETVASLRRQVEDLEEAQIQPVQRAAPDLLAALRDLEVLYRRDGEGWNDAFERVAEVFHAETGYLRPGKDCRLHSDEERSLAWEAWTAGRVANARAAIAKATGAA